MKINEVFPNIKARVDPEILPKTFVISEVDGKIIHFAETVATLKMNMTVAKQIMAIAKSDEIDNWSGETVELYWDKDRSGIRVREPAKNKK